MNGTTATPTMSHTACACCGWPILKRPSDFSTSSGPTRLTRASSTMMPGASACGPMARVVGERTRVERHDSDWNTSLKLGNARKSSVSHPAACASHTAWLWEARRPGDNSEAALLWLQLDFNSSAADGRLHAFLDGYQVDGHAAFVAHCHAALPSRQGKTKLARGVQTGKVRHGREMINVSMQHGFLHPRAP